MHKLLLVVALFAPVLSKAAGDTTIATAIKNNRAALYYPMSVERFYKENGNKLVWIAPDTVKTHAWDVMMLLDCVRQYGLVHDDYHPRQLLYDTLHKLIEKTGTDAEKVCFDILLTDAMIRFLNNLHYGKLNQVYTAKKIDLGTEFKADRQLSLALAASNFSAAINSAQPKTKLYFDLQYHLRLLVGLRSGDCYVIPKGLERKMAVNMERLRWMSTNGGHIRLTCIVRNGVVMYFKDKGNKDKILGDALFNKIPLQKKVLGLDEIYPSKLQ